MPLNALAGRPRARVNREHRARCEATNARCWLCRYPIDYTLDPIDSPARRRHPLRFTTDERIPRSRGGDPLDSANLEPAHAVCNSSRGNRMVTPIVVARAEAVYLKHRARATRTVSRAW